MSVSAQHSKGRIEQSASSMASCLSDCSLLEVAQVTASLNALDNAAFSVNTVSDLPCASENTGRFAYIKSTQKFRYSDGQNWTDREFSTNTNNLFSWGYNTAGQLGQNTATVSDVYIPTYVSGGQSTVWCNFSMGYNSGGAIKTDGTLWTWGNNVSGKLGDGTTFNRSSPGTIAGSYTTWSQVSVGNCNSAAIKTDGTLWTWGSNISGSLGDGTTVARCSPGTVAGGGTTWCQVVVGYTNTSAIKTDGTLWTWGCNGQGKLGDGTTVNKSSPGTIAGGGTTWCQVSSGRSHTLAITTNGTIWTWGCNAQGILGDGTTVSRSSPGTVAGGGTTWCRVSGGRTNTMAIKTDGTLWTWGSNSSGVLGALGAAAASRSSPGTVAGEGTNWCQVSAGDCFNTAIKTDGTLWSWGSNFNGELGNNSGSGRSSPGTVIGYPGLWSVVEAGNFNVLASIRKGF